ncbi:putative short-chain dehydrogenase/reductase family protein [Xylariaceae sp. FL1019]|nr:putative short-chain dehydrogenase/reductase family protein [Xylariaceae sp. FL1019]
MSTGESISEFLREHWRTMPLLATPSDIRGRVFIVTGSNNGIGFETAKHLVRLEASKVIIAVRNLTAGEEARSKIENDTHKQGVAEVWKLDLSSYDSVKSFAARAVDELERIDGVIENASIALDKFSRAEGMETSITVNVFSTLLLAVLLLPKMSETAKKHSTAPYLVMVTSGLGFHRKQNLEDIKHDIWGGLNDGNSEMDSRYGLSKLLQIYAWRELALLAPVSRTGVVINMISPGLCKTGLLRHARLVTYVTVSSMTAILGRTAEEGSRTVIHALIAGKESHGHYLSDCKIKDHYVPDWVQDSEGQAMQKRLWVGVVDKLDEIERGCLQDIS